MSRKPIVAYQGIAGAYSHLACTNALPDHEPMPCQSFEDMLAAVQEGEADRAMVPVENSVAGRVADIHHLLPESGLFIVGEYFQRVNHMLLGLPGTRLDELKEVRAHPQGLAQCRKLIKRLGLKRVNHADNAGAAHEVAALGDKSVAAIASSLNPISSLLMSRPNPARKCSASSGMSLARSRSGGRSICTTLIR